MAAASSQATGLIGRLSSASQAGMPCVCWTTPRPPVSLEGFGLILKQACPVLACPSAPLGQLGRQLRGQLAGQPLAGQLRDQLRFRLQVWDRLALQVWDRLALQVWERIKDQLQDQLGNKL